MGLPGNARMHGSLLRNARSALLAGTALLAGHAQGQEIKPVYALKQPKGCISLERELGNFPKSPATLEEMNLAYRRLENSHAGREVRYEAGDGELVVRRNGNGAFDNWAVIGDDQRRLRGEANYFEGGNAVKCSSTGESCTPMGSEKFPLSDKIPLNQPADSIIFGRLAEEIEGFAEIMKTEGDGRSYAEFWKGTAAYKGRAADVFEFKAGSRFDPARDSFYYERLGLETLDQCAWVYLDRETGVPLVISARIMSFGTDTRTTGVRPYKEALNSAESSRPAEGEKKECIPDGTIAWLEYLSPEQRFGAGVRGFIKGIKGLFDWGDESTGAPMTRVEAPDGRSWSFEGVAPLGFSPDGSNLYAISARYDERNPGDNNPQLFLAELDRNAGVREIQMPVDYVLAIGYGHQTHNSQIGRNLVTRSGCLVVKAEEGHGRTDLLSYKHDEPDGEAKWKRLTERGIVTNFSVAENSDKVCYLLQEERQRVFCADLDGECRANFASTYRLILPKGYEISEYANITISPDGSMGAITAFTTPVSGGELIGDEDIFTFSLPDDPRVFVPTRTRTEPAGHLFDRISTGRIPLSINETGRRVLEEATYNQNAWRGRPMQMTDSGEIIFTDDGQIYAADAFHGDAPRAVAPSPAKMLSYPFVSEEGIFFHSIDKPVGLAVKAMEEDYSFEFPGSIRYISVSGNRETEVRKIRGISPLFIVFDGK
ncbi:MAG: hypothetical protein HYW25_00895 [Candidatus Aenigmarchaeota archaeon]|nr:hypothetical protein [Candidatus Aenigmarchaeota archaeon]